MLLFAEHGIKFQNYCHFTIGRKCNKQRLDMKFRKITEKICHFRLDNRDKTFLSTGLLLYQDLISYLTIMSPHFAIKKKKKSSERFPNKISFATTRYLHLINRFLWLEWMFKIWIWSLSEPHNQQYIRPNKINYL